MGRPDESLRVDRKAVRETFFRGHLNQNAPVSDFTAVHLVIVDVDASFRAVGKVEFPAVRRKPQSVGQMDSFVHDLSAAIGIHANEMPQRILLCGIVVVRAREEPARRIGNAIVARAFEAIDLGDKQFEMLKSIPEPDPCVIGHHESPRIIERKAVNLEPLLHQPMSLGRPVVAVELAADRVSPVQRLTSRVPQGTFAAQVSVVGHDAELFLGHCLFSRMKQI